MAKNKLEHDLKELMKDLENFTDDFKEDVASLGDEFVKELESGHKAGVDPDGKRWEKRKSIYAWPTLNKTGELLYSYDYKKRKGSVEVENTAPYASYHQDGTSKLEQRKIIPDGEIPDSWMKLVEKEADKAVDDFNKNKK
jgi:phage gpG-like protein